MLQVFGSDAFSPKEIAIRIEEAGVAKVRLPLLSMATLGVLAGGFIGFGALYFTLVTADSGLGLAASRVLGGAVFSLGLILVVIAGAELFTGNNLAVMAWASGSISSYELLRNWGVVYGANAVGAVGLAFLVYLSGHPESNGGAVAAQAVKIASAKAALPFMEAFFRGILCNILVCLAIWIAMAGRTVSDKILAILLPISAFVAAGFEHVVANFYFLALGLLLKGPAAVPLGGAASNLVASTMGNVLGGAGMVALVYWVIYRRGENKR